jgi:hypothetical protein
MKRVGIGALLFCLGISAANAVGSTVAFDFRGSTLPTGNTWTDSATGVAVTATAQSTLAFQTGFPYLTDDPNKGLGVVSVSSTLLPSDPLINYGESIKFAFSPTIQVQSITLTEMQNYFGFGDYVTLSYFDGTTTQKLSAVQGQGSGLYDTYTYTLPTPVTAVTFTIGSGSRLLNSFGVGGINVDYVDGSISPANEPASVGIPASLWEGLTLLGALVSFRMWQRRRGAVAGA